MTMDLETRAFYRELLDYCVTTGPFPDDPRILGQIAMCSEEQAARLWPKVEHKFTKKGAEWINRKAAEVRGAIQERKGKISRSRQQHVISEKYPRDLKDDSLKSLRSQRDREGDGDGEGEGVVTGGGPGEPSSGEDPIEQIQFWLHRYIEQFGIHWPMPDPSICFSVFRALNGARLDDLEKLLQELWAKKQRPKQGYAWFVTVVKARFENWHAA